MTILETLRGGLVASCQPVPGGPMDNVQAIVAMARAARDGGARALRIEGVANVAAVVAACDLPVIGIVKRDLDDAPVRITPLIEDVRNLCNAGAHVVAVDATDRPRPASVAALLEEIRRGGRLAMADLSNRDEAAAAKALGFDILGTTLSGYVDGPVPEEPDLALVAACRGLGGFVIAEGRYHSPDRAALAMRAGAGAVCVGSALTRLEHVAGWFSDAISNAKPDDGIVLSFDIGGTKTAAALVRSGVILERRETPTGSSIGSLAWFDALAALVEGWEGRYLRVGVAATGVVRNGLWSALNPNTLPIPQETRLAAELELRLARPVATFNDAQAAAWGEHVRGAGQGADMVFVTVSSGIGGGIVLDGRLRTGTGGLAGSLGQLRGLPLATRLETRASGFSIASAARIVGRTDDTRKVFEALAAGEDWAVGIVYDAAASLAAALVDLQQLVDPDIVVIGGGIGLLPPFRRALDDALQTFPAALRPRLRTALLGADAGLVGAADLALHNRAASSHAGGVR